MTNHPDSQPVRAHRSPRWLGMLLVSGALWLTAAVVQAVEPAQGPAEHPESTEKVSSKTKTDKATETSSASTTEAGTKKVSTSNASDVQAKTKSDAPSTKGVTPAVSASTQGKSTQAAGATASKGVAKGKVEKTAASPKKTATPQAKTASVAQKSAHKTSTASARGQAKTTTMVPQDERVTYQYNALGRRDPFEPLIGGGFIGRNILPIDVPPDVGGLTVVGIVWGARDKFALAEDPAGKSLVLRRGDKVMNGFVERLKRDAIVVRLINDGQSQSVTIPLTRKGDDHGGN